MDFAQLTQLKEELDRHRPITPEKAGLLDEKLIIEWTYHSGALSGNTLSMSETAFFLKRGLTLKGKSLVDHLEARNHADAIQAVRDAVDAKRPLTEDFVKELHAILLRGIEWMWVGALDKPERKSTRPGQYKAEMNRVVRPDGSVTDICPPERVPSEMANLLEFYQEKQATMHPVELAAKVHCGLSVVHPFADGNGRLARLVMNFILQQHGYPAAIIRNDQREAYYTAVVGANRGALAPFVAMVAEQVALSAKVILEIVSSPAFHTVENVQDLMGRVSDRLSWNRERLAVDEHGDRIQSLRQVQEVLKNIFFACVGEPRNGSFRCLIESMDCYEFELSDSVRNLFEIPSDPTTYVLMAAIRMSLGIDVGGARRFFGHIVGIVLQNPNYHTVAIFPSARITPRWMAPMDGWAIRIVADTAENLRTQQSAVTDAIGASLIRILNHLEEAPPETADYDIPA